MLPYCSVQSALLYPVHNEAGAKADTHKGRGRPHLGRQLYPDIIGRLLDSLDGWRQHIHIDMDCGTVRTVVKQAVQYFVKRVQVAGTATGTARMAPSNPPGISHLGSLKPLELPCSLASHACRQAGEAVSWLHALHQLLDCCRSPALPALHCYYACLPLSPKLPRMGLAATGGKQSQPCTWASPQSDFQRLTLAEAGSLLALLIATF